MDLNFIEPGSTGIIGSVYRLNDCLYVAAFNTQGTTNKKFNMWIESF